MKNFDTYLIELISKQINFTKEQNDLFERSGMDFATYAIANNYITRETLAHMLKQELNLDWIDLSSIDFDYRLTIKYRELILKSKGFLPLHEINNNLQIAIADPFNTQLVEDITNFSNCNIELVFCSPEQITLYIHRIFYAESSTLKEKPSSTHSMDLIDTILETAILQKASDIHIEPTNNNIRVRFRIDGLLVLYDQLKKELFDNILGRIKIMSDMDISNNRLPADGNIKDIYKKAKLDIDYRVSTVPTVFGEKIVIRIIYKHGLVHNINLLGFFEEDITLIKSILEKSKGGGAILTTGPTGSGKTTTLASFIHFLNKDTLNIITIEDPVENIVPGVNHVDISAKTDLNFDNTLKHILRQDPDIIMVGEIRDTQTATLVMGAALTGHMVLSTLHTSDALSTITRLLDLGLESYLLKDALSLIISQQLIRRLCNYCKLKIKPPSTLQTNVQHIYSPKGCDKCYNTGYSGRFVIYEILELNSEIKTLIYNEPNIEVLRKQLKDLNIKTLKENAIRHVIEGNTSLEEIIHIGNGV